MNEKDPQTHAVIGAAMAVHRELGPGFLESVYAEALGRECAAQQLEFQREVQIQVQHRGEPLEAMFRADFICFGEVLVELKALNRLTQQAESQLLHYLKACKLKKGLPLNFGTPSLQFKRFVL